MLKTIDYILYKILEFFKRKNILLVWLISYFVISYGFYRYEISNGFEPILYWYDAVTIILLTFSYLRASWIIIKLNELEK